MAIKNNTSVRLYSYEELDLAIRSLAPRLNPKKIKSITPRNYEDKIAAEMLSYFSGIPTSPVGGSMFSVVGDIGDEICILSKVYESDHYNSDKLSVESIYQESDGSFMKVKMPWIK